MLLSKFHHLGVAVRDIDRGIEVHREIFACRVVSGPYRDPLQDVAVCFLSIESRDDLLLELVAPLSDQSPIAGYLRRGIGMYHMCYEVEDIVQALDSLRKKGCRVLSGPTPAVAFSDRKIAWLHTPSQGLVELLEEK